MTQCDACGRMFQGTRGSGQWLCPFCGFNCHPRTANPRAAFTYNPGRAPSDLERKARLRARKDA